MPQVRPRESELSRRGHVHAAAETQSATCGAEKRVLLTEDFDGILVLRCQMGVRRHPQ